MKKLFIILFIIHTMFIVGCDSALSNLDNKISKLEKNYEQQNKTLSAQKAEAKKELAEAKKELDKAMQDRLDDKIDKATLEQYEANYKSAQDRLSGIEEQIAYLTSDSVQRRPDGSYRIVMKSGIFTVEKNLFKDFKTEESSDGKNGMISEIRIGDDVLTIGEHAFQNNRIDVVEIPSNVRSIKRHAFAHNQIKEFIIPRSVIKLGSDYNVLPEILKGNPIEKIVITKKLYSDLINMYVEKFPHVTIFQILGIEIGSENSNIEFKTHDGSIIEVKTTVDINKPYNGKPPKMILKADVHKWHRELQETINSQALNGLEKQAKIQGLWENFKTIDPDFQYQPQDKHHLALHIKAEIWRQGKDGKPNWKADLNNIDTSLIKDMAFLFSSESEKHGGFGLGKFDGDINEWDVSKVTTMHAIFKGSNFNQPLNKWDVSSVDTITGMFLNARNFDQNLNDWDKHFKTDAGSYRIIKPLSLIFKNSPLEKNPPIWLAGLKNDGKIEASDEPTEETFEYHPTNKAELIKAIKAEIWRQGKNGKPNWKADLNNIDTSLIKDMAFLFSSESKKHGGFGLGKFDGDINEWDVSRVTTMRAMFKGSDFKQPLYKWDVSNVKDMMSIFQNAKNFNQPLYKWNVRSLTELGLMFNGASSFDQDLNRWDNYFKTDGSYKKISTAFRLKASFGRTKLANNPPVWLAGLIEAHQQKMQKDEGTEIETLYQPKNFMELKDAISKEIRRQGKDGKPNWEANLNTIDTSKFKGSMGRLFARNRWGESFHEFKGDISKWDVRGVKDTTDMFKGSEFNGDISNWDVRGVVIAAFMFRDSEFNKDLSGWDLSTVTDMFGMFLDSKFDQDLSKWGEHLKDAKGNYRNIDIKDILKGTPRENKEPKWLVEMEALKKVS